jgi:hypothetical protein
VQEGVLRLARDILGGVRGQRRAAARRAHAAPLAAGAPGDIERAFQGAPCRTDLAAPWRRVAAATQRRSPRALVSEEVGGGAEAGTPPISG